MTCIKESKTAGIGPLPMQVQRCSGRTSAEGVGFKSQDLTSAVDQHHKCMLALNLYHVRVHINFYVPMHCGSAQTEIERVP